MSINPRSNLKWKKRKESLYSKRVIFIPGNVPSSKNSRTRTKGGAFVVSKSVRNYRKNSNEFWVRYRDEFLKLLKGRSKPYEIGFHFVKGTKHKFDWVNPLQTVQDLMVHHEWIEDDNVHELIPFPFQIDGAYHHYDSKTPGVYIYIP